MEQITEKLYNWASILEHKTKSQACETAKMPFIYPHMALMPDAHLGMGATVGSVIPTYQAIMPAAVGVDIGCGMMAVRTQWVEDDLDRKTMNWAKDLHESISRRIPLSAGNRNQKIQVSAESRVQQLKTMAGADQANEVMPLWEFQLGTLGSGNHFIEVSLDEDDRVWLFLHSGSRGVGNKLAQKHIKVAKAECKERGDKLTDPDLAWLTEGTETFDSYIEALRWAQQFAYLNREEMMTRVMEAIARLMGLPVQAAQVINCHHNYTVQETYDGKAVWLSRKGAIDAHEGVMGLIPGSMGAASYVVVGLGNELALNSSPHGAGRNYSRSAAKREFTREDLDERMKGIAWGESDAFLDEHPLAYKDIDVVMADAADLVAPLHTLRQIVNVKGN